MAEIMILLGELSAEGDATTHLLKCLSGKIFPLAGVVKKSPYVRNGGEILENFADLIHYCDIYLVETAKIIQVLEKISSVAVNEIRENYPGWIYLPFRRRSCEMNP
jgi:hypothetical protein